MSRATYDTNGYTIATCTRNVTIHYGTLVTMPINQITRDANMGNIFLPTTSPRPISLFHRGIRFQRPPLRLRQYNHYIILNRNTIDTLPYRANLHRDPTSMVPITILNPYRRYRRLITIRNLSRRLAIRSFYRYVTRYIQRPTCNRDIPLPSRSTSPQAPSLRHTRRRFRPLFIFYAMT